MNCILRFGIFLAMLAAMQGASAGQSVAADARPWLVTLNVADIGRSANFYEKALGLREYRRDSNHGGKKMVALGDKTASVVLLCDETRKTALVHGDALGTIGIAVSEAKATAQRIRDAGFPVMREPTPVPGENMLLGLAKDPDGNLIEIYQFMDGH